MSRHAVFRRSCSRASTIRRRTGRATASKPGARNLWRITIGDYRVVYQIHDDRLLVLVLRIVHRKDVYRGCRSDTRRKPSLCEDW